MAPLSPQQTLNLAMDHHRAHRFAEAEALYRQLLASFPESIDVVHLLGVVAYDTGRFPEALGFMERSIQARPNVAHYHNNLGLLFADWNRLEESAAALETARRLEPGKAEIQYNLGNTRSQQRQWQAAIDAYRAALQIQPRHAKAWNNLCRVLVESRRREEALASYQAALQLCPAEHTLYMSLGSFLSNIGRLDDAVAALRRALALNVSDPEAHNHLGNVLKAQDHLDEALASCRRALQLKPDYAQAHNTLGNVLKDRGQLDEAIAAYRRSLALEPARAEVLDNLIYTLHFHPGQEHETLAEEKRRWNRQISDPLRKSILPHANERDPERRLRIGYVSSDFRHHVIGHNLAPLFQHHDHERFEILCYAGVKQPDDLTEVFRQQASQWRSTDGVEDEVLAAMIRADGVDILVDLAQHLSNNRLPVFARQPAPLQVSFAGYPASTGVEAIGYRISDRWLEPAEAVPQSRDSASVPDPSADIRVAPAEQLCLIDSFWYYDPCGTEIAVNGLPALENGWITFGSLNNFCKINEPLLKLWARVLARVPASRLMLLSSEGNHRQRTLEVLAGAGVEATRIKFIARLPRRDYLELYHDLDIVLDPHPYNGHTTSLDALWMGVPIVSLAGERSVSRAGLSMLSNLGLPELVAQSEEEYVRIAAQLAGDFHRLRNLRATLRPRMEASVLMDAPRFTRNIEAAYRAMWRRWCQEKPADE